MFSLWVAPKTPPPDFTLETREPRVGGFKAAAKTPHQRAPLLAPAPHLPGPWPLATEALEPSARVVAGKEGLLACALGLNMVTLLERHALKKLQSHGHFQ